MEAVRLTPCQTCGSVGLVGGISCDSCLGSGYLLTIGSQTATLAIPGVISPGMTSKRKVATAVTVAAGVVTSVVCVGSFGILVRNAWPDATRIFWQYGTAAGLFGLSGLLSMGSLSVLLASRTANQSLLQIPTTGDASPITLSSYASSGFRDFLSDAVVTSGSLGAEYIEADHVLLTLCGLPRIQLMLARLEISPNQLVDELKRVISSSGEPHQHALPVAQSTRLLMLKAFEQAIMHRFPTVEVEDIFLAYLDGTQPLNPGISDTLAAFGITYQKFLAVSTWYAGDEARHQRWKFWIEQARSHPKSYMNRAWTALPTPLLDSVGKDLTLLASYGKMSDGTSRERELEMTLQTLAGGSVKNIILIGEDGSGRSSIISAVATRILEDAVPEALKDKRLVELELNQLLTQGDGTSNLQAVINEVAQAGNVILSIPDVKVLAGTGEALDGSTILASALKDGSIQVITTSNYQDYHRYVEQNSSLKSQLQSVEMHELEPSEVLPILEVFTGKLEAEYNTTVTYPALEAAANLAPRYLSEKPAPAGAKQLLETACKVAKAAGRKWVRKQEVEAAVETIVQVPVSQASGSEATNLLNLEQTLHQRIIGQNVAVNAVAEALRRARSGLNTGDRPLGSFLFVGPTGVGKTELAKALCESYFGPESEMLRFDMSEYQNKESLSTLIGTTETQGGTLTQAIREKPFSLVLFDELEKAHPDILNLFLQVLDEGRLTEASGRTANFRNAIIIATSNAQARQVGEAVKNGADQNAVMQILEASFKPEFLNRFDGIIPSCLLSQKKSSKLPNFSARE